LQSTASKNAWLIKLYFNHSFAPFLWSGSKIYAISVSLMD